MTSAPRARHRAVANLLSLRSYAREDDVRVMATVTKLARADLVEVSDSDTQPGVAMKPRLAVRRKTDGVLRWLGDRLDEYGRDFWEVEPGIFEVAGGARIVLPDVILEKRGHLPSPVVSKWTILLLLDEDTSSMLFTHRLLGDAAVVFMIDTFLTSPGNGDVLLQHILRIGLQDTDRDPPRLEDALQPDLPDEGSGLVKVPTALSVESSGEREIPKFPLAINLRVSKKLTFFGTGKGDRIGVTLPGSTHDGVYHWRELGLGRTNNLERGRDGDILVALCAGQGKCTAEEIGAPSVDALRAAASRLQARLQRSFGTLDPFFESIEKDGVLVARFTALPGPPRRRKWGSGLLKLVGF